MTATLTFVPARFEAVPEFIVSEGQDCIDFAEAAGLVLDEWQKHVIRMALGTDPLGRWAAMEVALVVPRQNGKGSILEALELYHLFLVPTTKLITHTAHRFDTCLDHFRRVRKLIEETPELLALVKDNGRGINGAPSGIKDSNGKESIELVDGSRLNFKARDKGSGAGFSGDLVVLDEAWYLRDLSGLIPTMAARENPQAWYTSSAPHPRVESDNLRSLIRQGRKLATDPNYTRPEPDDPTLAYFEWSTHWAEGETIDLEDEDKLRSGNPAYGIRINRRFCRLERNRMGDELFSRERHGVFPEADEAPQWEVWSEAEWTAALTKEMGDLRKREGWLVGPVALAVEVPLDRSMATIGVAGNCRPGPDAGRIGWDITARAPGTAWVVEMIVALTTDKERPVGRVVIDPGSPAGSLIPKLTEAGVSVTECTVADLRKTTGDMYDAVRAGTDAHRGNPEIDEAVSHATKRPSGDAWLLDRRTGVDITPITAPALARYGHLLGPIEVDEGPNLW